MADADGRCACVDEDGIGVNMECVSASAGGSGKEDHPSAAVAAASVSDNVNISQNSVCELDVNKSKLGDVKVKMSYVETQLQPPAETQESSDSRKKRCTDRYDSSESSDSGVAVLSLCGSSSSSDITEPGSPYSPLSSASSGSSSEGAPGEGARPPWPWVPTAATAIPSPPCTPSTLKAKRPRADKCTNLESLISKKLHKHAAAMPAHPEPAANYNNNIPLVNTEEKKSNTQTSQHCCIKLLEVEPLIPGMTTSKVLNHPLQSSDCVSQIPKHIIRKAIPQSAGRTIGDRATSEAKLKEDRASQLKIQQGRITEYYKSQMKPSNGLKRDYVNLINKVTEIKGKASINGLNKSSLDGSENFGTYLSYLSKTFSSKMPINNAVQQKPVESSLKSSSLSVPQINQNVEPQKSELEKKPIPALNPILNSKNVPLSNIKKTDVVQATNILDVQNKMLKETKSRNMGIKLSGKRTRTMEGKKTVAAKVTKSSQTGPLPNMNDKKSPSEASVQKSNIECDSSNSIVKSGGDVLSDANRQITLSAIHNHMRQVLLQSQSSEYKNRTNRTKNLQSSSNLRTFDRVPSVGSNQIIANSCTVQENINKTSNTHFTCSSANLQSTNNNSIITSSAPSLQMTNSPSSITCSQINKSQECQTDNQLLNSVSSSANSLPNVSVPPATVMLTAIRIPQQNIQQPLVNSDSSRTTASNHIAISPTKINGQFVLPMVQNINGALVQIPSLVAKVGQNTVLPLSSSNLIQRTDNFVNVNPQQAAQMYINGALLKINGPVHPNLSGLIAKQMTATNTNVSYTVTQKNLTSTIPTNVTTVMTSKTNYGINVNHPILVSSPGFILNPMGGMVTTQSNTSTSVPVQQQFSGNVVLATSLHPNLQVNHSINNNLTSIPVPAGSIPISPVKIGDINRVFLTPTRQILSKVTVTSEHHNLNTFSNSVMSSTRIETSHFQQNLESTSATPVKQCPLLKTPIAIPNEEASLANKLELQLPSTSNGVCVSSESPETLTMRNVGKDCTLSLQDRSKSKEILVDSLSTDHFSSIEDSLLISEETKTSSGSVSDDLNSMSVINSVESPANETFKEIDDESMTNQTLNENIKIPMSSTPTIRFPPKLCNIESRIKVNSRTESEENKACRWNGCTKTFDDSHCLLEHLQDCHVNSQAGKETYTCLWEGCRVYNRSSCSRCWLERHVLSHGGTKLFRCIVDGCGQRFNTQLSLQRHVNNHFSDQGSNNATIKKSIDVVNTGPKLMRRNGKKLKYRRQPWSARAFDFFDASIMEGLEYRVLRTAAWRTGEAAGCEPSLCNKERNARSITLAATIVAKRFHEEHKCSELLVSWTPSDVLQDEWLPEKDFVPIKEVSISSLDASARDVLYSGFCNSYKHPVKVCDSASWSLEYKHFHDNTKTDSLVTNTANGTSLFVYNHTFKREKEDEVMHEMKKVCGAAKRKQWKR